MYLVNPLTLRVGYTIGWEDNWFSSKRYYPIVLHNMLSVRSLVFYLTTRKKFEESGLYLGDVNIMLENNKLLVKASFYDSLSIQFFKVRRFMRKLASFRRINRYNVKKRAWFHKYFFKRQVHNYINLYVLKFIRLVKLLGFNPDTFLFDNAFVLYNQNLGRKLGRLRHKYMKKKKVLWYGEEEFGILRFLFSNILMGSTADWISNEDSKVLCKLRYLASYMTYFPNYYDTYALKRRAFAWRYVARQVVPEKFDYSILNGSDEKYKRWFLAFKQKRQEERDERRNIKTLYVYNRALVNSWFWTKRPRFDHNFKKRVFRISKRLVKNIFPNRRNKNKYWRLSIRASRFRVLKAGYISLKVNDESKNLICSRLFFRLKKKRERYRLLRPLCGVTKSLKSIFTIRYSYIRFFYIVWLLRTMAGRVRHLQFGYLNRGTLSHMISLLFSTLVRYPFLKVYSAFLEYLIFKIKGFSTIFDFYILSNDELSAAYIARHIANCFKLGFKWKEVVLPIRRDLRLRSRVYFYNTQRHNNSVSKLFNSDLFFRSYNYLRYKFYTRFYKYMLNCKNFKFYRAINPWHILYCISRFKVLPEFMSYWNLFFRYSMYLCIKNMPLMVSYSSFKPKWKSYKRFISNMHFLDISRGLLWFRSLSPKYGFDKDLLYFNIRFFDYKHIHDWKMVYGFWLNTNLLRYSVWRFIGFKDFFELYFNFINVKNERKALIRNYGKPSLKEYSAMTNRILRLERYHKYNYIYGFKLRFSGRFKRRSRRAHVWYKFGQLGLTKISGMVDYGESVVPLQYSAFSVRVWIYKNNKFNKYNFKLLSK